MRHLPLTRALALAGAPVLALFLAALGCHQESAPQATTYTAPPPAHPALKDPSVQGAKPADPHADPHAGHAHPPMAGAPGAPVGGGAAPPPAAAPAAGGSGSIAQKLAGLGLLVKVPAGWVEEGGQRPMRLGTIKLPKVEGDAEDGELSVSAVGGGVEQNVERWRGQFQEKPQPVSAKKDVNGLPVTTVEMEGTFSAGGPMMAAAGPPKAGTKLLGAIVELPGSQELIFFKAWGPKATMERWKPAFEEFTASFRRAN